MSRLSRPPCSSAHARRRLAAIDAQIASWRAIDCTGDWRKALAKRRALVRLEAERPRFDALAYPAIEPEIRLPF